MTEDFRLRKAIKILPVFCNFFFTLLSSASYAQHMVLVDKNTKQHIFQKDEIEVFKDSTNQLSFAKVSNKTFQRNFKPEQLIYPVTKPGITYWCKVKINSAGDTPENHAIIEFFDQTTNAVTAYLPDNKGNYEARLAGADLNFENRLFKHKNFEFIVRNSLHGEYIYYFKIKCKDPVNVIMVYRSVNYFIYYALNEYFMYGLLYGIIVIFSLHNLLMFVAVKQRQYLIYVVYLLSVGFYQMSSDGIAYQYLWSHSPHWNEYAFGIALYMLSISALLFTEHLLHVPVRAPHLKKLIDTIIIFRTLFFIICLFNKSLFYLKYIEFIPLSVAFFTGAYIWVRGFKPARFFVLGYTCLSAGFLVKLSLVLGYQFQIPGFVSNYSLSMGFVLEMLFLSFAISDQVRILRHEKERVQKEMIRQINENAALKDSLNSELESKVEQRTKEVIIKSKEIYQQAYTIEAQNRELIATNQLLETQAAEILRMNSLLAQDNVKLKRNIERVTAARIMSAELSFEEFGAKYPDQEACHKLLSELKWSGEYHCVKCNHNTHKKGKALYSRRCTRCNYEESVLHNTIFENNRITINKAFYLVYLIYTSKGSISSYQLSERLEIRQSTCWQYASRIKKIMEEHKAKPKRSEHQGWIKLIMLDKPKGYQPVQVIYNGADANEI
jgi:hypothetical protein